MLNIQTLTVGDLTANCYLVTDPATSDTLIIDPGDDADFITETIINQKLKPLAIILTHGHFDHVLGCLELKLNFNLPIHLHQADARLYTSANRSAAHWLKKKSLKVPPVDQFIKEGDEIKIGSEKLKVIETPGHTPGSICLFYSPPHNSKFIIHNSILFTGDTLFKDGVGRTDFSYSSESDLQKSLSKISKLQSEMGNGQWAISVYPGHGETTTIGDEKATSF